MIAQAAARPESLLLLVALVFMLSAIARAIVASKKSSSQPAHTTSSVPNTLQPSLRLSGAALLCVAIVWGATLIIPDISTRTLRVIAALLAATVVIDALSIVRWPRATHSASPRFAWVSGSSILLIGAAALGYVFFARSTPANSINIQWPVKGEWRCSSGGRLKLTNHHKDNPPAQDYAVDLVTSSDKPTEGQAVYAPVTGTVLKAQDEDSTAEGCHLILRIPGNINITFAHLQKGSIKVKEGDNPRAGTLLALCGATGSATAAHLHIHAELDSRPVPLTFGSNREFLVRGDRFAAPE